MAAAADTASASPTALLVVMQEEGAEAATGAPTAVVAEEEGHEPMAAMGSVQEKPVEEEAAVANEGPGQQKEEPAAGAAAAPVILDVTTEAPTASPSSPATSSETSTEMAAPSSAAAAFTTDPTSSPSLAPSVATTASGEDETTAAAADTASASPTGLLVVMQEGEAVPTTPAPTEQKLVAANIDVTISFRGGSAEGAAFMLAFEEVLKAYGASSFPCLRGVWVKTCSYKYFQNTMLNPSPQTPTPTPAFRVTPSKVVPAESAHSPTPPPTPAPTAAPTALVDARRRRQRAVTRKAAEGAEPADEGCGGALPLFIQAADAEAAQAAIAALQAILSGATPLVADGGGALDASLLCGMDYRMTYVYDTIRIYGGDDMAPNVAFVPRTRGEGALASTSTWWGVVGGGVGALVVIGALALVGVSMRRLLARSDGSWDVTPAADGMDDGSATSASRTAN